MNNDLFVIRKTRSIGEILKVSYLYFSAQGGPLLKALLFFALPVIIVSSVTAIVFSGNRRVFSQLFYLDDTIQGDEYIVIFFLYFLYACGLSLFNLIVNKQLALTEATSEKVGFATIKTELAEDFRLSFSNFIILFVIYFIVSEIASAILSDMGIFLYLAGSLLFLPIVLYFTLSLTYIGFREKTGLKEAAKKVMSYAQNRPAKAWLGSTLLFLMMYTSYLMVSTFFNLIYYLIGAFMGYSESNDLVNGIITGVQAVSHCFIFVFVAHFQVAIIYLNGSIEDETEGHYIQRKMDKI